MSSISLGATSSPQLETASTAARTEARVSFLLGVSLFIIVAYMIPFDRSWNVSTYEHYADAALNMEGGASEGILGRQMVLLGLGLIGLVAAIRPGIRTLEVRGPFVLLCIAFLVWSGTSCLWADQPTLSFRRFVALLCEVIAGIGIAKQCSPRQFVWIVFLCTAGWLGLGFLAEISHGTLRPGQETYRFSGILHPNDMGFNCALVIMSSLYLAHREQRGRAILWTVLIVAFVFLFLTRSRTSLGCTMMALGASWLIMAPRRYIVAACVAGFWLGVVALIMYGGQLVTVATEAITMGRVDDDSASLTGRLPLWEELFTYVADRPLTGYGYNGFWTVEHMREVSAAATWNVSIGHSSYVDLILSVGYIGLVLCMSAILAGIVRAIRLEKRLPLAGYGFVAMVLGYTLIGGISETTIGITWFASLFGMCALCQLTFADAHAGLQLQPRPEKIRRRSKIGGATRSRGAFHATQ